MALVSEKEKRIYELLNKKVGGGIPLEGKEKRIYDLLQAKQGITESFKKQDGTQSPFGSPLEEITQKFKMGLVGNRPELVQSLLEKDYGPEAVKKEGGAFLLQGQGGEFAPIRRPLKGGISMSAFPALEKDPLGVNTIIGAIKDPGGAIGDLANRLPGIARTVGSFAGGVAGAMAPQPTGPIVGGAIGTGLAEGLNTESELLSALGMGLISPEEFAQKQSEVAGAAGTGALSAGIGGVGAGLLGKTGAKIVGKSFPEVAGKWLERGAIKGKKLEAARIREEIENKKIKGFVEKTNPEDFGTFSQKIVTNAYSNAKKSVDDLFNKARELSVGDINRKKIALGIKNNNLRSIDSSLGIKPKTMKELGLNAVDLSAPVAEYEAALLAAKGKNGVSAFRKKAIKSIGGGEKNFAPEALTDSEVEDILEYVTEESADLFKKGSFGNLDDAGRDLYRATQRFKEIVNTTPVAAGGRAGEAFKIARAARRELTKQFPESIQALRTEGVRDVLPPSKAAEVVFSLGPEDRRAISRFAKELGVADTFEDLAVKTAIKREIPSVTRTREAISLPEQIGNKTTRNVLAITGGAQGKRDILENALKKEQQQGRLGFKDLEKIGGDKNVYLNPNKIELDVLKRKIVKDQEGPLEGLVSKEKKRQAEKMLNRGSIADRILQREQKARGDITTRTLPATSAESARIATFNPLLATASFLEKNLGRAQKLGADVLLPFGKYVPLAPLERGLTERDLKISRRKQTEYF